MGRLVVEKLKQRMEAQDLIALVRSPEKATDLGIAARAFDYAKPETLAVGLQDIDHLMFISGSEIGKRAEQHRAVIEAAQQAGVKAVVYTSLLHADTSSLILAGEHLETEAMLKESGIPHTILRNGWYTENHYASIATSLQVGTLYGSAGQGKISSATREDYAEAAAVVLARGDHKGEIIELAGDQDYTLAELAQEISRQAHREIPYVDLPEARYAEVLSSHGLPAAFARAVASFDVGASQGALFHEGKELSQLIGRPTTSLGEAVKQALA